MAKHKWSKVGISLLISICVICITGFIIVPMVNAASCFPDVDGHWAEDKICWLKNMGITGGYPDGTYRPGNNVTRAEMAVMLKNLYEATISNGQILISSGHINWMPYKSNDPLVWEYFSNETQVRRTSTGGQFIHTSPDIPTVLYQKRVYLYGVTLCYDAAPGAYIDQVWIRMMNNSNDIGTSTEMFHDGTNRTDEACRYYALDTPHLFWSSEYPVLFVDLQFNNTTDEFKIGRTTWHLRASGTSHLIIILPSEGDNLSSPPSHDGEAQ